ncbi:MAG TPA: UbiX family flavin prenyltransferase [Syntrophomonadaceae bacterium]|nr:UbiX family flavin prenyltransferase [Syntrophomonadaceae bacterium]
MINRMIVGISGASGALLGIELLKTMQNFPNWETHLVISKGAERTILEETNYKIFEVFELATKVYPIEDIGASIASGTFKTDGMVIIPCSMKTLGGIASGYSDNLLLRAADVTIKERRNLVLVTRESPFSRIHLKNMLYLAELGSIILPPVLNFYNHPENMEDFIKHVLGKVLDVFDIELNNFKRWGENEQEKKIYSKHYK